MGEVSKKKKETKGTCFVPRKLKEIEIERERETGGGGGRSEQKLNRKKIGAGEMKSSGILIA